MKAFPIPSYTNASGETYDVQHQGMDLRDYFAAKAMSAIIGKSDNASLNIDAIDSWVGEYAYKVADAMMKEREENE